MVMHEMTVTRGPGDLHQVRGGTARRVKESRFAAHLVQHRHEGADAGATVRKIRRIPSKRHIGHQRPVETCVRVLRYLEQPITNSNGPTQCPRMQLCTRRIDEHETCAGCADRRVVDLAITFEAMNIRKRHRFYPSDPVCGTELSGTRTQPIERVGRCLAKARKAADAGSFSKCKCKSRPACIDGTRLALRCTDVRGQFI